MRALPEYPQHITTAIQLAKEHNEVKWLKKEMRDAVYSGDQVGSILEGLVNEKYYDIALQKAKDAYLKDHSEDIAECLFRSAFALGNDCVVETMNFICEKGKIMSTKEGLDIARHLKEFPDFAYKVRHKHKS